MCHLKDWQSRQAATLFDKITLRLPRLRCPGCGGSEAGTSWLAHCRSAPELDQLQAHLSALMPYRVAAGVLVHLLPVAAGTSHETLRDRTLEFGEQFTDGCSGLRAILAAVGITGPPSLDWFHLSMRLQHAKQVAETLPAGEPSQQQAKAGIIDEVERLRWRIWNGMAKDARITLKRLRTLLLTFKGEPVRKQKRALRAVDRYLRSQSAWLINYAERWRAGLRVGTSLTEGTANFLVNRRMAKLRQMRWFRRGADLLLQVRCAVYNGTFGCGFGQLFEPTPGSGLHRAEAA